jgi:folate-dependent tRNA-U54 methylase TrmFO/GidA
MNANFGILPPLTSTIKKSERKKLMVERAIAKIKEFAKQAMITEEKNG